MASFLIAVFATSTVFGGAWLIGSNVRPRRRRSRELTVGRHRRAPRQPPSAVLHHAIVTAGQHGLGLGGHSRPRGAQQVRKLSEMVMIEQHCDVVNESGQSESHFYRMLLLEWPVVAETSSGRILLPLGTDVDALFMSAGFAAEVNSFLARHMMRAPIIMAPGEPNDWIFLTRARTPLRLPVWKDLAHMGVRWRRRGDTIPLPQPDAGTGMRWLEPPRKPADLPPWTSVVGAARAVWKSSGG